MTRDKLVKVTPDNNQNWCDICDGDADYNIDWNQATPLCLCKKCFETIRKKIALLDNSVISE